MSSPAQLLAQQLSGGVTDVLLVIGAVAVLIGLLLLWGYIVISVEHSDEKYHRENEAEAQRGIDAANKGIRSLERGDALNKSGWGR